MPIMDRAVSVSRFDIMLPEIGTGRAYFMDHRSHLTTIIEFITLKINRVINSILYCCWVMEMKYVDRIRALREDKDLSQTDVARLLNIGQKTYSDYELGKTRIPLDSMLILAKYYNVSMDYLCGTSDRKTVYPRK